MKRFKRGTPSRDAVDALAELSKAAPREGDPTNILTKSSDELRYTLGPLYSPLVLDAHGEYTDAEELRKSLWDFSTNGDKQLRKQHGDERIGDIVELFQWPYEHVAEVKSSVTGELQKVKFPADTVYAGVVWSEDAWPLVKSGKITGYSMGGTTFRLRDAMDDSELAKFGS